MVALDMTCLIRQLILSTLRLLQAQDIRLLMLNEIQPSFANPAAQTSDIPAGNFVVPQHFRALRCKAERAIVRGTFVHFWGRRCCLLAFLCCRLRCCCWFFHFRFLLGLYLAPLSLGNFAYKV
uniref:Secreted protein n=1 Tax=Anopheles darlingi TaxID=43151 RepID=A0A2M4D2Y6_ANODA